MFKRRDILRGCSVLAGSTALAGCNALPSLGTDDGYQQWIPDRGDDEYAEFYVTHNADLAAKDGVPAKFSSDIPFGLDAEDVQRHVGLVFQTEYPSVLETTLAADELVDRINEAYEDVESIDGYAGYDRYGRESADGHVAVRDGVAVIGSPPEVVALLDARREAVDRLVEADEDMQLLSEALGTGDRIEGRVRIDSDGFVPELGETLMALGNSVDIGPEVTEVTDVTVYPSEAALEGQRRVESVESSENASDVTSSQNGRVLTITYRWPTDSL